MRLVSSLRALALLSALTAGVAAGCGGDDDGASRAEVQALLRDTFGAGRELRSGKLDLRLTVDAKGLGGFTGPLRVALRGPFQSRGGGRMPKFDFDLDLGSGGSTFRAGAISTGTKGYVTVQERAYELPGDTFRRMDRSRREAQGGKPGSRTALQALGVDPRRWLRDPRHEGDEDVAGTPAVRVSAAVDVPRFLDDVDRLLRNAGSAGVTGGRVPGALDPAQRRQIARSIRRADVDVWTGRRDRALRRIALDVRFRTQGGGEGTVRFAMTLGELNRTQAIGAPADPRPVSELTAALQQLATGAAGGQQGGAGGGQQGGAAGGQQGGAAGGQQGGAAYDRCLADAGADLAEAQGCAQLLGR